MMYSYVIHDGRLLRQDRGAPLSEAIWIDLISPSDAEVRLMCGLGLEVPTLAEMEEIEISNRLYRDGDMDYMTAVLPGEGGNGNRVTMPVSFILSPQRLVTVRHHSPRPFLTYPDRGERSALGCGTSHRLFIGLIDEIVARLADILEGSGRLLDDTTLAVFETPSARGQGDRLQAALRRVGREAEALAQVRLSLLTIQRMLAFYVSTADQQPESGRLRPVVKGQIRDVQALEVHADFLGSRVSLAVDTTLGLINLEQNSTVRILSVVAALFLPPTLIASIYGMNFEFMPELDERWGYPLALALMAATAFGTWLVLRWKRWL